MIDEVKEVELYDLNADMAETNNVAKLHPEVVDRLMKQVEVAPLELADAGTIGTGSLFFDKQKKRPDVDKYKQWETAQK